MKKNSKRTTHHHAEAWSPSLFADANRDERAIAVF
jgi:hypothetical protein